MLRLVYEPSKSEKITPKSVIHSLPWMKNYIACFLFFIILTFFFFFFMYRYLIPLGVITWDVKMGQQIVLGWLVRSFIPKLINLDHVGTNDWTPNYGRIVSIEKHCCSQSQLSVPIPHTLKLPFINSHLCFRNPLTHTYKFQIGLVHLLRSSLARFLNIAQILH